MFQSFDTHADPSKGAARLALLRAELARLGLTGFICPRADEHQGEYVPASAERLAWLTGFSGSAGTAVVLKQRAAVFVDGRYTLQVRAEVDTGHIEPVSIDETPVNDWLKAHLSAADRIGYDPSLHTMAAVKRLAEAVHAAGAALVQVAPNPIDTVWTDRPAPPTGRVSLQPMAFSGEEAAAKLARLAETIAEKKAAAAILTQPDSIAWAFNIRGSDVPHTPLPLSHAILAASGRPSLFIDGRKLGNLERAYLEELADVREPADLPGSLDRLGVAGTVVMVDPNWVSAAIASRLTAAGARLIEADDPCRQPKAIKNAAEIAGMRAAHLRDGVALVRFLAWLDAEAPGGGLDEIAACEALERFRAETGSGLDGERGRLLDVSFDTISGAGPNGAIVHYHSSRATNRPLDRDSLFLVDSGAQYRDGTTDVTRTIAVGMPSSEMRDRFTRVLKGMIAIAAARFPAGTTGHQLDVLARISLWSAGLDYMHGTGHGIGSYLSVHEGPQNISKRASVALEPGMVISDEPGYYKTGEWGIRIENLVLVTPPEPIDGGERPMLGFETLTLAPIDRRLIEPKLLTHAELGWIDAYHARVDAALSPHLDDAARHWLQAATAPL
ncbi:MAG: aminopeptidase P family protein [Ancalomicrobiaceae bacterium]|nr:aminopeptidase P family protein [Ancalomicrobiaceae bacterium]